MRYPWSPEDELDELFASDDESWRGDIHLADESWRGDVHVADAARRDDVPDAADAWRGDVHFAEWPEESAGPEYWMYKKLADEG